MAAKLVKRVPDADADNLARNPVVPGAPKLDVTAVPIPAKVGVEHSANQFPVAGNPDCTEPAWRLVDVGYVLDDPPPNTFVLSGDDL